MEPNDLLCSRNARLQKGGIGSHQTILLARRTRTMKLSSSDVRSEGQSSDSLRRESVILQRSQQETFGVHAQWNINQPPSPMRERVSLEGSLRRMRVARCA